MTPAELAEIRARAEAATPGPWQAGRPGWDRHLHAGCGGGEFNVWCADDARHGTDVTGPHAHLYEADAAFIAAARTDVPALCDEVERLQAEARALRLRVYQLDRALRGEGAIVLPTERPEP